MKIENAIRKLERKGYEVTKSKVTKMFGSELIAIANRPNSGTIEIAANVETEEITAITIEGQRQSVSSIIRALEISQIIGVYGSVSEYKRLMGRR